MIGGLWIALATVLLLYAVVGTETGEAAPLGEASAREAGSSRLWNTLVLQASALGLPTRFLQVIPKNFVQFEFGDLRAFAAEYHPEAHQMILNASLSLNAASGTLKPLAKMTHQELQTLYHELVHAYIDFLGSSSPAPDGPSGRTLLNFARAQQDCRYSHVRISPIPQRKSYEEERFLSDRESWEALNESWAVFIGWAIWTELELRQMNGLQAGGKEARETEWVQRLAQADRDGDLRGYYEPEDPAERQMVRKRVLSPSYRISPIEVAVLMREVLEKSEKSIRHATEAMEGKSESQSQGTRASCGEPPQPG